MANASRLKRIRELRSTGCAPDELANRSEPRSLTVAHSLQHFPHTAKNSRGGTSSLALPIKLS